MSEDPTARGKLWDSLIRALKAVVGLPTLTRAESRAAREKLSEKKHS